MGSANYTIVFERGESITFVGLRGMAPGAPAVVDPPITLHAGEQLAIGRCHHCREVRVFVGIGRLVYVMDGTIIEVCPVHLGCCELERVTI